MAYKQEIQYPPFECLWDQGGHCQPGPVVTPTIPVGGDGGTNPPFGNRRRQGSTVNIILPASPLPQYPTMTVPSTPPAGQAAETKIFGMSPLMAIGVGIGALWLLGSMGGETKHRTHY